MSDNEDDFVTYGNALEPLDTENLPRKKPITIENQFAYDTQGRRRFHGAFTGGFSAGYFNTVGTRDGWRPQQFKSTRINKAENIIQYPEDFMDEEDTGEFGIAPTVIRATQEYSFPINKGTKREHIKQDNSGPIPGTPVLREFLKPVWERVGVMLLKKMGWKSGQGVGPRLTKHEKKQKNQQREKVKIYGCALPNQQNKTSDSESESSKEEYANVTFAPDDYEPFICNPKDNYFGIGYSGLDRRPILTEHVNHFEVPAFNLQEKNKKLSIRGQAFGVGAFETEDDDIYAKEDMSRYDFALGSQHKCKSRWSWKEVPKTGYIEGFIPSKEQQAPCKIFEPPVLQMDFQPIHKVRKSRFSPLIQDSQAIRKRYEMNAESRAKIINDDRPSIINSKKIDLNNSSVAVKLITRTLNLHEKEEKVERQKLKEINTIKKMSMSWLDKLSCTTFVKGEIIGSDIKVKGIIHNANKLFKESDKKEFIKESNFSKPTFADLDKQRRFEQYQKFSETEIKPKFDNIQSLSMTDWERNKEIEEFEKIAKLCENIDKAKASDCNNKNAKTLTETRKYIENLSLEDRMSAAAQMKMFGKLTRIESEWKPAKLVCIRFNIAEPSVKVAIEGMKKKKFSIFDSLAWSEISKFEKKNHVEHESEPRPSTSSSSYCIDEESNYKTEITIEEASTKGKLESVSKNDENLENTYEKIFEKEEEKGESFEIGNANTSESKKRKNPEKNMNVQEKKDLYKSIFLSSSEDSETEDEEVKNINNEKLKTTLIGNSAAELNAQRNTSPPRGIFAQLDLDSLLKRLDKTNTVQKKFEDNNDRVKKIDKIDDSKMNSKQTEQDPTWMDHLDLSMDVYGPALPKVFLQSNKSISQKSVFIGVSKKITEIEDSQWVEKTKNKKKSKKEKKKHKHKEHSRSKSRKKSKKEKRH